MAGSRGSRLHVCHVLGDADTYGIVPNVRGVAELLDRAQFDLTVYVLGAPGLLVEQLRQMGVPVRNLNVGGRFALPGALDLLGAFRQDHVDILHAHVGGRLLRRVARMTGCRKVISHIHGPPDDRVEEFRAATPGIGRFMNSQFCNGADLVLATSDWVRRVLVRALPSVADRVLVAYPPADTVKSLARDNARRELGLETLDLVVGFVGRLVPQKGIAHLARLIDLLLVTCPQARFVLVGAGPLRPVMDAAVERHGPQSVRVLGRIPQAARIMRAFDVLVVPSQWEAFGTVSVESQAVGVPVVAFDVDGLPETMVDGVTGCLVPGGDSAAMAETVRTLLGDGTRLEEMGRAGKRLVAERFGAQEMTERLAALYVGA